MNKQLFITILLTVLMSMTGAKAFAHDIEVANNDGVTIYYVWTNSNTELAVSYRGERYKSYSNEYNGTVVIPEYVIYNGNTYPVTSIGDYAFSDCSGLTSVTIPNNVTSIGGSAFEYCRSLTFVTIPNNVTSIGGSAFEYCSGLTSVTIPNNVTSIGGGAFWGCHGLTSVTIPNSVTSIGEQTFFYCNGLATIVSEIKIPFEIGSIANTSVTLIVPAGSKAAYQSTTGWSNFTKIVEVGEGGFVGDRFIIDGVIYTIGENNTAELTSSKKTISDAFQIPSQVELNGKKYDVTSIGYQAFYNCSGLTSVIIPNSVTSIGSSAFDGCNGLITIVSEIKTPFEIGNIASNSETLIVPAGTKAAYQSTPGWSSFTKIVEVGEGGVVGSRFIIDGIHYTIGENNTASLTSTNKTISGAFAIPNQVELNGNKYDVASIGNQVFYNCSDLTSVNIPNSVTSIGDEAFCNCSGLASVTIPNSVISIGQNTFSGCSGLTSVTIPNSVTSIGYEAFCGCSGLTSVIIGSGVTSIGSYAFSGTNLKKTIWLTNTPPSGYSNAAGAVNYVSNDQFSFNDKLIYQYQFLSSYFDVNGIRYVPISPSERICDAIDCVYDESVANTKIASTVEYKGVTMTVKDIKPYLAYNNKFIKTLTVDNDGELADYAFTNCSNLETATHGEKIIRIGKGTFSGCSSLTSLTSSEKTTLSNVLCISKNVTTIDDYAFKGCSTIKNIIFMDSDEELKLGANNIGIGTYFGDSYFESLGTPLFSDCPLDSVYIGRNIDYNTTKQYGYSPFYSNTSLRAVKIADKETEISDNEFYGCINLQRVVIGDGVTNIGNWAFSGCQSLKFFAFGSHVVTIGKEAFSDCAAIVEIISKAKSAPACGSQALDDINKWECKLFVPDGCTAVYEAADQWKDFLFKDEGEGTASQGESGEQIVKKCEMPTISLVGDKLSFACATEGVVYHYTISHSDVQNGLSCKDVNLTQTYTITVFARKDGYGDSEVARATIKVSGNSGLSGDVDGNGVVNVADHVKLSDIILNQNK